VTLLTFFSASFEANGAARYLVGVVKLRKPEYGQW
jgi:hypothetical protein